MTTAKNLAFTILVFSATAALAQFNPPSVIQPTRIPSNFDRFAHIAPAGLPAHSGDNQAAFRFECHTSHLAYDDPIVYPNQPGVSHLHHFFGNAGTNAFSTYDTMRKQGDGSCEGGPLNRTGYWFPALIDQTTNKVRIPDYITVYYKQNEENHVAKVLPGSGWVQQKAVPLIRGMKYIFGANPNDRSFPHQSVWNCDAGAGSELGSFQSLTALRAATPCASGRINARLDGPGCWNGTALDSPNHRSHMSEGEQDSFGHLACHSATYDQTSPTLCPGCNYGTQETPYPIIFIAVIVTWSHDDSNFGNWYLSSDRMPGGPAFDNGESFHTDWFMAWDDDIAFTFEQKCLGYTGSPADIMNASTGNLCNGTQLTATLSTSPLPVGSRSVDIPVNYAPSAGGHHGHGGR